MGKQFRDARASTFAQATAAQYLKAGRMTATLTNVRRVYAEQRARVMGAALKRELSVQLRLSSRRVACSSGPS